MIVPTSVERSATRLTRRRLMLVGILLGGGAAGQGLQPIAGVRPWLVLLFCAAIVTMSAVPLSRILQYRPTIIDLLFVATTTVQIVVEVLQGDTLGFAPDVFGAGTYGFYYVGYVVARLCVVARADLGILLEGLILPVFPTVAVALMQVLAVGPVTRFVLAVTSSDGVLARIEDGRLTRAGAFVGHWTALGTYLVCVLAATMVLAVLARSGTARPPRGFLTTATVAGLLGCVTTLTVGVIVSALAVVLVGMATTGNRIAPLLVISASAFLVGPLLGDSIGLRVQQQFGESQRGSGFLAEILPNTLNYRIEIWTRETLPAIQDSPWLGWGRGVYEQEDVGRIYPASIRWSSPESQWLSSLMNSGLIGSLPFFMLLAVVLVALVKQSRKVDVAIVRPVLVMYGFMLVMASTAPVFTVRGLAPVLWPLVGALVQLTFCTEDDPPVAPNVSRT